MVVGLRHSRAEPARTTAALPSITKCLIEWKRPAAYGEPKKTQGGSSLWGVGLPPEAPTALCCGCVGFVGSTPAIEAIQLATPLGDGFAATSSDHHLSA